MRPDYLDDIRSRTLPTDMTELRSFLGAINWYRDFIEDFANLTRFLTDKTNNIKGTKLDWGTREERAEAERKFEAIKTLFVTEGNVLLLPQPNIPFRLTCDASHFAIGAVLEQQPTVKSKHRPIGFMSKKLNPAQMKYTTYKKRCLQ